MSMTKEELGFALSATSTAPIQDTDIARIKANAMLGLVDLIDPPKKTATKKTATKKEK